MTKINNIIKDEITPRLQGITGVTVLDGWITHYVHKFSAAGENLTFPVVAIQPDSESFSQNGQRTQGKATRAFRLVGAVSNKNPELITEELNNLLYGVRKALAFNIYDNKLLMQDISFGEVAFNLPDKGEPYAFFELMINVSYQESYE